LYIGRTGALESLEGESVHAPAGLYEIKGEESSAESDEKQISNVAITIEVDLRTRDVETSHLGRMSALKKRRRIKAKEPGQQGFRRREKKRAATGACCDSGEK